MAQIYMPPTPPKVDSGRSGGGKTGGLLGAIGGGALGFAAAAAAGPVGWAAAPAILGGAAGGSGLGSMIGEAVKPTRQGSVTQPDVPPPVQAPDSGGVQKRMADIEQSQMYALSQAKAALQGMREDLKKHYQPYIDEAMRQATHQQRMA